MTLLSERCVSNKTDGKEVSYKALYEDPLTRKTRLKKTIANSWAVLDSKF